jgi:hypothetical protein
MQPSFSRALGVTDPTTVEHPEYQSQGLRRCGGCSRPTSDNTHPEFVSLKEEDPMRIAVPAGFLAGALVLMAACSQEQPAVTEPSVAPVFATAGVPLDATHTY